MCTKKNGFQAPKWLSFTGQESIASELDRLQLFVEEKVIEVQIVQSDERIIVGVLQRSTHPGRVRIQSNCHGLVMVLYTQIVDLIHDLTPDRTSSLSREGSNSWWLTPSNKPPVSQEAGGVLFTQLSYMRR